VTAAWSPHRLKGFFGTLVQDSFCWFGGEVVLAVKSEPRRKMTRQEAGRLGGEKVARERGSEFYRVIGRKGGEKVAEERGAEFYRQIGRRGGENRRSRTTTAKEGLGVVQRSQANQRKNAVAN
jgi:general stress protein YciG